MTVKRTVFVCLLELDIEVERKRKCGRFRRKVGRPAVRTAEGQEPRGHTNHSHFWAVMLPQCNHLADSMYIFKAPRFDIFVKIFPPYFAFLFEPRAVPL